MKGLLLLFDSLLLLALASSTTIHFFHPTCYNSQPLGKLVQLDVTPCDSNPCRFPRGHNVTLTATFTSPVEIVQAKPVVYAHLAFLTVPEPFHMEQNACNHFDTPCPLAADTQHSYTASVFIEPDTPALRVVAEWQIRDQSDNSIICFRRTCSGGRLIPSCPGIVIVVVIVVVVVTDVVTSLSASSLMLIGWEMYFAVFEVFFFFDLK
ncbi:NPC intracellular cholesterol transporter 2-like [Babylonia areolata]|uniref:NPC intracellular cholesterol transporter 2-like n=1 Tax=Babylonia areolata TaxID=304850 RepID=UPI003FD651FF